MNTITATLLGGLLCCGVPVLSFVAGVYYARFGLPIALRWRGFGRRVDEDEGA